MIDPEALRGVVGEMLAEGDDGRPVVALTWANKLLDLLPAAPAPPGISPKALAEFVRFVRMNPQLDAESTYVVRAFQAYRDSVTVD